MSNEEYMKSIKSKKPFIDDWAIETAIELYHAYFEKDKADVINFYADTLRKGERHALKQIGN